MYRISGLLIVIMATCCSGGGDSMQPVFNILEISAESQCEDSSCLEALLTTKTYLIQLDTSTDAFRSGINLLLDNERVAPLFIHLVRVDNVKRIKEYLLRFDIGENNINTELFMEMHSSNGILVKEINSLN